MEMLYADDGQPADGWLSIYACRHAFVPHVESAVAGILGRAHIWQWWDQPVSPAMAKPTATSVADPALPTGSAAIPRAPIRYVRADLRWRGTASTASRLASSLRTFPDVCAELVARPALRETGRRFLLVPELGLWSAAMDESGEPLLTESQLQSAVAEVGDWQMAAARLFGRPWEEVLAPLREAAREYPASLLRVV